jgi:hypothetical protein
MNFQAIAIARQAITDKHGTQKPQLTLVVKCLAQFVVQGN